MELAFNAPALLWALPVAALPVLFHVRARAKERAVDFPGAFFLQNPALPSAERRRRLEDLFLLALRCVLLALAVTALAGPRVRGWGAGAAAGSEALAAVLDDSPSVSLRRDAEGREVWTHTLETLSKTAVVVPRRRVALETASGQERPLAAESGDSDHFVRQKWSLSPLSAAFSSGDRTAALTRAVNVLREAPEDCRVALLVSDFNLNEEEGQGETLAARWSAALRAFGEPGAPALVAVVHPAGAERQWSVGPLRVVGSAAAERAPVAGPPFRLRVSVRALSGAGTRVLRVFSAPLRAGREGSPSAGTRKVLLERTLILGAGETAELEAPVLSAEPGALWLTAQLEGEDELPFDDRAEAVVQVRPKRACVLWDLRGNSGDSMDVHAVPRIPARSDAAWQAVAYGLDPLDGSEASRVRLVKAGTPRAEQAAPGTLLVALYGPRGPVLGQQESERLRGAIEAGATLLWAPDLTGAAEGWPTPLPGRAISADPLLPRAIEGAEALALKSDAPPGAAWRVADAGTGHPLLRPFAGGRNGDLPGVRFGRRVRLAIEMDRARQAAGQRDQVLARFDDGLPAAVFQPLGAGGIYQLAFGIEPRGGLAASPAWPVLLAEAVELAAGDGLGLEPGPLLTVGASVPTPWPVAPRPAARAAVLEGPYDFLFKIPGSSAAETRGASVTRWELELPARAEQLALPTLAAPGLYRLASGGAERWVEARIGGCESSLESLPASIREQIAQAAHASGGGVAQGLTELDRTLAHLRPGRSLAPFCWALFAAAMVVELACLVWRGRMG